jgi:tetratricopeptide (TPR) repeat protein
MRVRLLPVAAALLCLAGAGWYVSRVDASAARRPDCASSAVSRLEVEKSFAEIQALTDAGKREEAVLALRSRVERGPYPGAALFLLGEITYGEGAYGPAVGYFKKALEADPSLSDRDAPFHAARRMLDRAEALRKGPWADNAAPEAPQMNFLIRRLSGGCE